MSDGFSPPEGVRAAARRGLELRRKFGRGGTLVGVARARDLSNGKSISASTIKRMVSFFARHAVDKRPNWSDPSKPTNGYIAHMLWGGDAGRSWANKVSRSIDAKKSVTEKHLPGKHNQRTHGRRGYGSSRGGGGLSAEAFVAESTRLGNQTQRELDNQFQAQPRQWYVSDFDTFITGVTDGKSADWYDNQNNFDIVQTWMRQCANAGLTPEQALRAWHMASKNSDTPTQDLKDLLTTIRVQDLHHERAVAVSRMSYAEQDSAFDMLTQRIATAHRARNEELKRQSDAGVLKYDLPYDPELVSDCEAVMALALYGNPDLRLRAVAYAGSDMPSYVQRERITGQKLGGGYRTEAVEIAKQKTSIYENIQYYSLEYRLHLTSTDFDSTGEVFTRSERVHQKEFIREFTRTHTTQNTSNVLGAAIQSAMSQVGPNRESSAQSLYPKGIKPPEPHPKIVKFLQQRYEQTQREYAQSGVTEVQLYRGTKRGPINGIPMSPWSDSQSVSQNFTGGDYLAGIPGYKPTLNRAPNMPVRYVFMHYGQSDFRTAFTENEFLILETTAVRRGRVIRQGNIGFVDDVTWSIKQLQAPNPYDQADGIVDYSLVSLYEPQYDIFYNYRKKPSKPKVKKKHLPGGHDQRNHGRRGKRGGGGGAYPAVKYDEATEFAPRPVALSELHPSSEFMQTGMREVVNEMHKGWQHQVTAAIKQTEEVRGVKYTGGDDLLDQLRWLSTNNALWWISYNAPDSLHMVGDYDDAGLANYVVRTREFQAYVYRRLGYNGKPKVVPLSELDNQSDVIKSNGDRTRMFYRGVQETSVYIPPQGMTKWSAQDVTNDFRNGATHYVGIGIDGNGTYATYVRDMDLSRGESYDDENFRQYRHARTYSGAPSTWDNTTGDAPEFRSGMSDMIAFVVRSDARVNREPMYYVIQRRINDEINNAPYSKKNSEASAVLQQANPGTLMALLGYQGYYADHDRFVLLDRRVAIVGDSTPYEPVKVTPDIVKQRMKK